MMYEFLYVVDANDRILTDESLWRGFYTLCAGTLQPYPSAFQVILKALNSKTTLCRK
jgi:hypothetical protein